MTQNDSQPETVTGTWFGSYLGLAIVIVVPVAVVTVPLAAFGQVGWILPIGLVLGACFGPAVLRPTYQVSVRSAGVVLTMGPQRLDLDWSEIESIDPHRFRADLVFKEPRRLGIRKRRSIPLIYCDPNWRNRPTVIAATRRFNKWQAHHEYA